MPARKTTGHNAASHRRTKSAASSKKKASTRVRPGGTSASVSRRSKKTRHSAPHGQGGCSAAVLITEQVGSELDEISRTVRHGDAALKRRRADSKASHVGKGVRVGARMCRVLAAAGHETRIKILLKLLSGPATYRAVQRVTKAPPGPLYHHINQLRLAGLIRPKQRDLYELTRGGRNLVLGIAALTPLVTDRRRRPVG